MNLNMFVAQVWLTTLYLATGLLIISIASSHEISFKVSVEILSTIGFIFLGIVTGRVAIKSE